MVGIRTLTHKGYERSILSIRLDAMDAMEWVEAMEEKDGMINPRLCGH